MESQGKDDLGRIFKVILEVPSVPLVVLIHPSAITAHPVV